MRIGVYIGSFNPPHKGHAHVVNYLLNNNVVDKVLIVPTEDYWDKHDLPDISHRINMLKTYENDNIKIDSENNGYPYTYLLMRKLKEIYPSDDLYLIMGADNIIQFYKWKNYEELLNYNIIIMNREGIDIPKYAKNYPNGRFTILRDFIPIDISSTEIRANPDSEYIDEPVRRYIKENNLYGNSHKR